MLSSETKAAGMLLFAMKLFFGLDDKRESKLTPVLNEYNDDLEAFNFVEWIQQLRLRMHVWQGKSIDTVTGKGFSADQSRATDDGVPIRRNLLGSNWYRQRQRNDEIFKMCVPNYLQDRHQEFLFERLCVDKEVKRSNDSKEALFTPLMFHAKMNEDFVAHISTCNDGGKELANVDLKNLEVFFKSFVNSHMDFKCTEKLDKAYDDNPRSTLPDLPASNSTSPNVFHRCFPCSDAYLVWPQSLVRLLLLCFNLRAFLSCKCSGRSVHVQVKCATEAEAVISRTSVVNLFNSSKRFFSSNFATLLRHFAITVCETEDLIYLAFLMCESMFFDRSSHQALEDNIRARSPIFLEHKNTGMRLHESVLDGSSAHKFKYKLFGIRKNVHAEATADSAVAEVPATRTQAEGGSGEAVEVDQNAAMRAGEETITEVPLAVDDEESDGSAGLESDSSLDEVIDEDSTQLITVVVPQPLALALVGF